MDIQVNHREKFSGIQAKKSLGETVYSNEPITDKESDKAFEACVKDLPEAEPQALLNGYHTLIVFVSGGMILGAILATVTMFAVFGPAIERGKLVSATDSLIREMQYNTAEIRDKVSKNERLLDTVNANIEKLGKGIVEELKPKTEKVVSSEQP